MMNANQVAAIFIERAIAPDEEFTAAAGRDFGYVAAWALPEGWVIRHGDNAQTDYAFSDSGDDLHEWLEYDDLNGLDRIVQTAYVRGEEHVDEADQDAEGPFFVLITRYWYGPTENSLIAGDDDTGNKAHEFKTWQDAQDWIDGEDEGIYTLAHNESGAPSYKIVTE